MTASLIAALAVTAAHADPTRTVAGSPSGTVLGNLAETPDVRLLVTS